MVLLDVRGHFVVNICEDLRPFGFELLLSSGEGCHDLAFAIFFPLFLL